MNKRIAAALLCLILILTVMPLSSSAENAAEESEALTPYAVDTTNIDIQAAMNKDIRIGMNLYYHCDNNFYEYPFMTENKYSYSYQTYPNEPATIYHCAVRASNDSGSWQVIGDYAPKLKGKVKDYVQPNFFSSPDTIMAKDGTIGLADPTGEKVKAMLTLEEADYNAIVEAWIVWAKDNFNTDAGYSDGTFTAVCKDKLWDTAQASDYKAVPYVIKRQTDENWFIDMVIVPVRKHTLGYDRNLEHGYSLPKEQKFPETATYDAGAFANIVGNPNVTPSMTNDKGTFYAEFLYWVDKDGNKYGNGYTMTIPMWEDKVLYAIWNYEHDPQFGNIRITKEVTNLNSDVVDDTNPDFPMTVTLTDTNGTTVAGQFAYTIYDSSSVVQSPANSTISSGGQFNLKDGWYIIIRDLPKDTSVTITEAKVHEYLARNPSETKSIVAGNTTRVTMKNIFARLDSKYGWYTVEHYFQDEKGNYAAAPDFEERIQVLRSDTEWTDAKPKNHDLFTLDTEKHPDGVIEKKFIETDGSTVIEIYYARLKYPYLVRYLDQDTQLPIRAEDLRDPRLYLATVSETAPDVPHYTLQSVRDQSLVINKETDDDSSGTITANEIENNVFTFYYTENQVEIQYQVVGPDGCGTVTKARETVKVMTGKPGCEATANPGHRFMGWYLDAACTQPVSGNWVTFNEISPQRDRADGAPYTAATYYAKFECVVGDLEVSKTVSTVYPGDTIPDEAFQFTLSLTPVPEAFSDRTYPCVITIGETSRTETVNHADYKITFSLKHGETALISGLPLGGYQVTETLSDAYTQLDTTSGADGTIQAGKKAVAQINNAYDPPRGNLTIEKQNAADPEQVFVYEVKNSKGEIITVTVVGNDKTTIHDLLAGDYTVTQRNDWSWRYDDGENPSQSATVTAGATAGVTFTEGVTDNKWLDGNSPLIKNRYREDSAV